MLRHAEEAFQVLVLRLGAIYLMEQPERLFDYLSDLRDCWCRNIRPVFFLKM